MEIRSHRMGWREVPKEKAISYAKGLLKQTGIKKNSDNYTIFLNRYIRGLDLDKI